MLCYARLYKGFQLCKILLSNCYMLSHVKILGKKREGNKVSCAKHTVKNLFTYLPIHLFTKKSWIASHSLAMTKSPSFRGRSPKNLMTKRSFASLRTTEDFRVKGAKNYPLLWLLRHNPPSVEKHATLIRC